MQRTVLLALAYLLAVAMSQAVVAQTLDELIVREAHFNDKCRGGAGDLQSVMRSCDQRDALVKQLEQRGWCWGHPDQVQSERHWERCENSLPHFSHVSPWFGAAHQMILDEELRRCDRFAAAGNLSFARSCRAQSMNAHDFLMQHEASSLLPVVGWLYCEGYIANDLPLGARCVAAAEKIAKIDAQGRIIDLPQFIEIMTSGAWVANPSALELRFDQPRP